MLSTVKRDPFLFTHVVNHVYWWKYTIQIRCANWKLSFLPSLPIKTHHWKLAHSWRAIWLRKSTLLFQFTNILQCWVLWVVWT